MDLNSDLGEGFGTWRLGDDAAMLDIVSSANVACGFHAGDPRTLLATCEKAVSSGVVIGAQVGYRDLAGFGRRFIDYETDDLVADLIYQLGALDGLARAAGDRVLYVKPHGALYNTIVHHEQQAAAVVDAVRRYDPDLPVLGLPGSAFLRLAEDAGLRTVREAFADRGYNPDGTLVSRRLPGALLHDPTEVAERMVRLVTDHTLVAVDGSVIKMEADSICVHGDSPGAVEMARAVHDGLAAAGVRINAFAGAGLSAPVGFSSSGGAGFSGGPGSSGAAGLSGAPGSSGAAGLSGRVGLSGGAGFSAGSGFSAGGWA